MTAKMSEKAFFGRRDCILLAQYNIDKLDIIHNKQLIYGECNGSVELLKESDF